MEENYELLLKSTIQHQYSNLAQSLDCQQLSQTLMSIEVISVEEYQHISREYDNKGPIAQTKLMLDYILVKDGSLIQTFVDVLKSVVPHIYATLEVTIKAIKNGDISIHGGQDLDVDTLSRHVREMYLTGRTKWNRLEPIPGLDEDHNIVVNIQDQLIMKPVFRAKKFNTASNSYFVSQMFLLEKYITVEKDCFEDLFEIICQEKVDTDSVEQMENMQKHLIWCNGIAGVGKSTVCKRLVCAWAKKEILSQYEAIFLLPVREIRQHTVIDMLSDDITNENGVGLVTSELKRSLDSYLNDPNNAKKIAFIIDGADERDTLPEDLQNLIKGKLYTGCTVFITARPEAKSLKLMEPLLPLIKVKLDGTDDESVQKFVGKALKGHKPSDIEIETLYQTLYSLLLVPLYLTLMCILFEDTFASGVAIADFKVPQTTTQVFNSFLNVIIRRWLSRQNRKTCDISYKLNPLAQDSTVPGDMKRILYFLGNMCYNGLCVNKYEFNMEDLRKNCLEVEDIIHCGLFCVHRNGNDTKAFTTHIQFQEYLAGLYLAHDQTSPPVYTDLFKEERSAGKTLIEVIGHFGLLRTIQFTCGLSSACFQYILRTAKDKLGVIRTQGGNIDIHYEASLLMENNSEENQAIFCQYLLSSNIIEKKECVSFREDFETSDVKYKKQQKVKSESFLLGCRSYYFKALSIALSFVSKETAIKLFDKLYKLSVTSEGNNYRICHAKQNISMSGGFCQTKLFSDIDKDLYNGVTIIIPLDQVLFELLSKFIFDKVNKVIIRNRERPCIAPRKLVEIFPSLHTLSAATTSEVICYDNITESDDNSMLESIRIISKQKIQSTDKLARFLINQRKLKSVWLHRTNFLSGLVQYNLQPCWNRIVELKLFDKYIHNPLHEKHISCLCEILQSNASTLETLSLFFCIEFLVSIDRLSQTITSLPKLRRLFVFTGTIPYTEKVLQAVSKMSTVEHLVLDRPYINGREDEVITMICDFPSLKQLDISDANPKLNSYKLSESNQRRLRKKRIDFCGKNVMGQDLEYMENHNQKF